MTTSIHARGLCKEFPNGIKAVTELELTIAQGEVFGFLGPNGAGKSTTVRMLNGALSPTSGECTVLGYPLGAEQIRARTATVTETAAMYEQLTLRQNLQFFATLHGLSTRDAEQRIDELLAAMHLEAKADLRLGTFSTGMKKRAQLARALLHRPEILFLDEPTSGLDPDAALQVNRLIRRRAERDGTTVFLCTHNLSLAEAICDTFGFIVGGRLVRCGTRFEIESSLAPEKRVRIETDRSCTTHSFDVESDIDARVREVLDRGEHLREVRILKPGLEDAYFHYIGRSHDVRFED